MCVHYVCRNTKKSHDKNYVLLLCLRPLRHKRKNKMHNLKILMHLTNKCKKTPCIYKYNINKEKHTKQTNPPKKIKWGRDFGTIYTKQNHIH